MRVQTNPTQGAPLEQMIGEVARHIIMELKPILEAHEKKIQALNFANMRHSCLKGFSETPNSAEMLAHVKKTLGPVLEGTGRGGAANLKAHIMGMMMGAHARGEDPFDALRRYAEASGYQGPQQEGREQEGDRVEMPDFMADLLASPMADDKIGEGKTPSPAQDEAQDAAQNEKNIAMMRERGKSIRTSSGPKLKKKLEDYTPQERYLLRQTDPKAYAALYAK